MRSLNRYILRQCLIVTLFVTAALTATVWLAQSLRLVDLIVNRGLSAEVFALLALLFLPRFVYVVLPIGTFIAVLYVFNRLTIESELVVMRAAGMGPLSLARPVLVLAGIVFTALMLLSAYLLPAANREFKDLQFEIRNRFVSSLLQEGAFTTIGENLTVYIGSRNERGEVVGILVNDERDPQRPITIFAERGAFVDSGSGSRIIMANGNRQQFDRKTDKLSHLSFDRYTLELDSMREVPSGRFQEAQERFLGELFFPAAGVEPSVRRSFSVEGHQRLTVPLSAFAFAILPLACLLPGQFNRRGQLKRVLLAIGIAFLLEATDVGVRNFAARYDGAIPLMYMTGLLPFVLGFGILLRGGIRAGFRRPAAAALAAR